MALPSLSVMMGTVRAVRAARSVSSAEGAILCGGVGCMKCCQSGHFGHAWLYMRYIHQRTLVMLSDEVTLVSLVQRV